MMLAENRLLERLTGSFWGRAAATLALTCGVLADPVEIQAQVEWTDPQALTEIPTDVHSSRPRVATDGFQNEGVENWISVWESKLDGFSGIPVIQASRSYTNGDSWQSSPQRPYANPQYLYLHSEETGQPFPIGDDLPASRNPDIAASRDGYFIAVWEGETTTGLVPDKTDIGFAILTSRTEAEFTVSGQPLTASMLGEADTSSDFSPSIATDNGGNWIVVWRSADIDLETTAPPAIRLKASTSTDNGVTWGEPAVIAEDVHENAEPVVRSNETGLWVVLWSDVNPDKLNPADETIATLDIFSSYSEDVGASWSPRRSIHEELSEFDNDVRPTLIASPGRGWLAAWTRVAGSTSHHLLTSFAPHPEEWVDGSSIATDIDSGPLADLSLAWDGSTAAIASWGVNIGAAREVHYALSMDFGSSWDPPAVLAAQPATQLSQPAVGADGHGKWVAVFATDKAGLPLYSTTVIPIPGHFYSDLVITGGDQIFQAPTEPEHPHYSELPLFVTYTVENRGPDPAFECQMWLWMLEEDFTPISATINGGSTVLQDLTSFAPWVTLEIAFFDPLMPGEKVDVTFEILPKALEEGFPVENRPLHAHVYCDREPEDYDPYLIDNEISNTVDIVRRPPLADLSTTMESYPQANGGTGNGGFVNNPMALIVHATNTGEDTAEAVLLDEVLEELVQGVPAFTFNYAACTQGSWKYERLSDGRGRILCNFGSIRNGQTATLVIAITPHQIGTFSHGALARSIGLRSLDLTPEDAYASGPFKVTHERIADISVTLQADSTGVPLNGTIRYTAVVENHGDSTNQTIGTAYHPRVVLTLPAGAEVKSVTLPDGSFSRSTGAVICGLKALKAGASTTLQVEAVLRQSGTATTTANVSNFGARDSDPSQNSASVTASVGAQALPAVQESGQILSSGAAFTSVLDLDSGSDSSEIKKKSRKSDRDARKARLKARRQRQ